MPFIKTSSAEMTLSMYRFKNVYCLIHMNKHFDWKKPLKYVENENVKLISSAYLPVDRNSIVE